MRTALLLLTCLALAACGMKGDLYEPAPVEATAPPPTTGATPPSGTEAAPPVDTEATPPPRGDRKTIPSTPDPDQAR